MTDDTEFVVELEPHLVRHVKQRLDSQAQCMKQVANVNGVKCGGKELTWEELFSDNGLMPVVIQRANLRYRLAGNQQPLLNVNLIKDPAGLCLIDIETVQEDYEREF